MAADVKLVAVAGGDIVSLRMLAGRDGLDGLGGVRLRVGCSGDGGRMDAVKCENCDVNRPLLPIAIGYGKYVGTVFTSAADE